MNKHIDDVCYSITVLSLFTIPSVTRGQKTKLLLRLHTHLKKCQYKKSSKSLSFLGLSLLFLKNSKIRVTGMLVKKKH